MRTDEVVVLVIIGFVALCLLIGYDKDWFMYIVTYKVSGGAQDEYKERYLATKEDAAAITDLLRKDPAVSDIKIQMEL